MSLTLAVRGFCLRGNLPRHRSACMFPGEIVPRVACYVSLCCVRCGAGSSTYQAFLEKEGKGIAWLCKILVESDEYADRSHYLDISRLATQLHHGIEGCADEEVVAVTFRMLRMSSANSLTKSVHKRAAELILMTSGLGKTGQNGLVSRGYSPLCICFVMPCALG